MGESKERLVLGQLDHFVIGCGRMEYQDDVALWVELSGSELCHDATCDLSQVHLQIQKRFVLFLSAALLEQRGNAAKVTGEALTTSICGRLCCSMMLTCVDMHSVYVIVFDLLLKRLI